ncbi:MAG: alpha/beta hydrolase [Sneathiellaceae bacterium]
MGVLDPGAKIVVDLVRKAQAEGAKPVEQLTVAEGRDMYENQRAALTPDPPEVAEVKDFAVPGPRGEIQVRLYRPAGSDPAASLPVIVYYHGGGWVIGSLNTHDVVCRGLANESGCAVLSVDYRMAPEHAFPAAGEDSYAVLEWLVAAGDGHGLDATRIGVAGDSAGGNLSAVMTLMAQERNGPRISWQGLIYPATDFRGGYASRDSFGEGYLLTVAAMNYFENLYLQGEGPRTDWRASPILAEDLTGLPPATIVTAGFDPLRDEGRAYADRLRDAGVPVTYKCFDGQIHGFFTMGRVIPEADAGIRLMAEGAKAALQS